MLAIVVCTLRRMSIDSYEEPLRCRSLGWKRRYELTVHDSNSAPRYDTKAEFERASRFPD